MPVVDLLYSGIGADDTASQDWLILEQESIPQSQQICTVTDLRNMLALASIGQAAKTYVSDKCPIRRRVGSRGSVIASYRATILVHRSETLAGAYDLIQSEGRLSIGQTITRRRSQQYELKYEAFKELGWLPAVTPQYSWLTKVKNADKVRVFAPKNPTQENGYLYFEEAYKGTLQVSGTAIVDKYTLTIEHQQGYQFDKTILLTAEWGPEDVNGNRESVQIEVKLPQCVIDEFNKCAGDMFSDSIDDGGGWNVSYGPKDSPTYKLLIGACSGDVLKKQKMFNE